MVSLSIQSRCGSALGGRLPFQELVTQLKREMLDVMEHDSVPFERVVEALGVGAQFGPCTVISADVCLPNKLWRREILVASQAAPFDFPSGVAKFDLTLFVDEQAQSLSFEYSSELAEKASISRLADKYL